MSDAAKNGEPVDMLPYLESTMAEVTINIFLSQVSIYFFMAHVVSDNADILELPEV